MPTLTSRLIFTVIAVACFAALGFALYAEHVMQLHPCPLCMVQRLAVFIVGVLALIFAALNPQRIWRKLASIMLAFWAFAGAGVSFWHVHLQNLPPNQAPACGPGLGFMVNMVKSKNLAVGDFFNQLFFTASGDCTKVDWLFLGGSMPFWTGLMLSALGLTALYITSLKSQKNQFYQ
ncbi:MAG: disulfide bond formation protein B [Neisseriaceae bacterium]|nr:disulfide bond formation protein B [Neisseriaceae bacterium]